MSLPLPPEVLLAAQAGIAKLALDPVVLDLRAATAFTDYFVLLSGANQKQLVAIADNVRESLRAEGLRPVHIEGYPRQEWILLDFDGFVVHVFAPRLRAFYDLERLWGGATRHEIRG